MTFADAGLWCEIVRTDCGGGPALFLDRDGVINEDTDYVGRAEDVRIIQDSALAIARCNALGIPVVIVTNQSGIGRGYYDWNGFHAVQAALSPALSAAGAHFDAVLACAYHGEAREPLRIDDHPWRKPNPGMLLTAAERMNLDLSRSWIVGDRSGDLAAGAAAGLPGGTLLPRDENERREALGLASVRFVVRFAVDLAEAVATLLESGHFAQRVRS
jgi:D-glycero-D-manno-heptose 1,7-bisphosphate phosphatase